MHWRRYLRHPALSGFAALEAGPVHMLVRAGFDSAAPLLGLDGDPASAETIAGGRARHPVVLLPGGSRAVVRRYHRGGAVRHLNRATYFAGHRAFHELLATERARAAGVRAPAVLAATERRTGLGYAAWLATRLLQGTVESAAWLASASADARLTVLSEAGRQIALMHDAGIAHPDLNLRNLLVATSPVETTQSVDATASIASAEGSHSADSTDTADRSASTPSTMQAGGADPIVYLIDFDGARLYESPVPGRRRASDLRRLARSVRKLAAPVGAEGWMAMREGYGAGWPLPADETRALG
jgi:3-deoxy-D-manno-octulosonic acid kinase